jgi:hypothetical protein
MIFAYANLAISAACMILSNHVKDKIRCTTDADCLLPPNTHNFYQCSQFPSREGAYLYFDSNKGCFIWSGKVCHQGFTVQGKEHLEESKKVMYSSHFYYLYPLSCCPRAYKRGTKGTFDTLQQVIAAGWSPRSDPAKMLDRSWNDRGLLIFSEKESKQIRASMGKGMTKMQTFHMCAAYQFEMGYDLAI